MVDELTVEHVGDFVVLAKAAVGAAMVTAEAAAVATDPARMIAFKVLFTAEP